MISVLCPTRGRPANVARLVTSGSTLAEGDVEFVLYVDDDDETMKAARNALDVDVIVGPRILLSECWNRCAERATGEILMHCGDDIMFRTSGWDRLIAEEFERWPDRIVFVHGDDGYWGERFGTHGFLHRRWIETIGYFVPPYFSCDWNDTWLNDVANALGRRVYRPDVVTEHLHPAFGKRVMDRTDAERMARGVADDVDTLYLLKTAERAADAAKLREAIGMAGLGAWLDSQYGSDA